MICTQSLQSYGEFLIPANDVGCLTFLFSSLRSRVIVYLFASLTMNRLIVFFSI